MSGGAIRAALAAGRPSIGIGQLWPGGMVAERTGAAGYDWVLLDCQHGGHTEDGLQAAVQGVALGGGEALVRVGSNDARLIGRALDCGAAGVIVPMVDDAEAARAAAAAVRYPPLGQRSFGPLRGAFAGTGEANERVLCLVMIESVEAMSNLEAIVSTPGVDGVYFGPVDLAISMGLPANVAAIDPAVLDAAAEVAAACERHGVIPGSFSLGPEQAEQLLERGMRLLALGSELALFMRGAAADLERAAELKERYRRGQDATG